jgi:hypothetical protein
MAALAPALVAAPTLLQWLPCAASCACCLGQGACAVCCSAASCFGCARYNAFLSRLSYLLVYFFSACLGIAMRYWGQAWLQGAATAVSSQALPGFCAAAQCWGMQAAYRISLAVAVFFALLCALAVAVPVTHLGGWLAKLVLYVILLGLSFLPPNDALLQYAAVARGFSALFLLLQVLIIIDFAYNAHEWLVSRVDAKNAEFEARGFEPGLLSNGWGVLYVAASLMLLLSSLAGLGAMFFFFGNLCQLHNFFISETLVLGVVATLVSLSAPVRRGLLPPSIIWAYNTYLCFGAITNNPDGSCNPFAGSGQSEAAIFGGLVVAALSVSWSAFANAGSISSAVRLQADGPGMGANSERAPSVVVSDWPNGAGSPKNSNVGPGFSAPYQGQQRPGEGGNETSEREHVRSSPRQPLREAGDDSGDEAALRASKPWLFDATMCIAGMYLAMLVTNWGSPDASNSLTGNPELSAASMWARISTQFVIHALFLWSLVAPLCCPGRDFGASPGRRADAL